MCSVALDVDWIDDTLDVLRHHRRRFVLSDLDGRSPPVDLADLAERVADSERGLDASDRVATGSTSTVERIEIDLHHRHLPMLVDAGLVRYRHPETTVVDWVDLGLPDGWRSDPSIEPLLAAQRAE